MYTEGTFNRKYRQKVDMVWKSERRLDNLVKPDDMNFDIVQKKVLQGKNKLRGAS